MTETQRAAMQQALEALESDPVPLNAINNARALLRAALAEPEPEQEPKPIALPSEDKARQAFWDCYPDSGNADMRDVWMTCYRWCRAIVAVPQQQAEPEPEPEPIGQVVCIDYSSDGGPEIVVEATKEVELGTFLYTTPPARRPLTLEQIMDAVRDADLDWHAGWSLGDDAPNRFITLIRAIERAHGITGGNDE